MRILTNVIDGMSGSVAEKENSILEVAKNVLRKHRKNHSINFNIERSLELGTIKKSLKYFDLMSADQSNECALLIGKSKGGIDNWNLIRKYTSYFSKFKKVALVTVDPHGSVRGDGLFGPFYKRQSLYIPKKVKKYNNFEFFNVHQTKRRPTGASFPEANININIKDETITHKNIVSRQEVILLIDGAIKFLET